MLVISIHCDNPSTIDKAKALYIVASLYTYVIDTILLDN